MGSGERMVAEVSDQYTNHLIRFTPPSYPLHSLSLSAPVLYRALIRVLWPFPSVFSGVEPARVLYGAFGLIPAGFPEIFFPQAFAFVSLCIPT